MNPYLHNIFVFPKKTAAALAPLPGLCYHTLELELEGDAEA